MGSPEAAICNLPLWWDSSNGQEASLDSIEQPSRAGTIEEGPYLSSQLCGQADESNQGSDLRKPFSGRVGVCPHRYVGSQWGPGGVPRRRLDVAGSQWPAVGCR
jgi:hypothetical protein